METPFREVAGHAANIGLRLIFLAGLAGTLLGQGTSLCGKYSTILTATGPTCQRVGILPWLIAIPGQWETELRLGVGGDTVRFSFFSSLSLMSNHINLAVEDNEFGSTFFEGLSALELGGYKSHWTRILGQCGYDNGPFTPLSVAGSMIVSADGPNGAVLDEISVSAVYKYTSDGTVVSETAAPVIFRDQATVRWSAIVTETPLDQQSQPGATITSVAVANLSPDPQAVLIQIYDEQGNLAGSAKTPVLNQALGGSNEIFVGGIYAGGGVTYPTGIAPAPPELYDPVSGTFAPAGEVTAGRASTSTLLYDGEVLIAGGWKADSAALYDPTSESFTSLGHLLSPGLWDHSATLLPNSRVLIAGGRFFDGSDMYNAYGEESLATAQLYDPSLRRFKATGSMLEAKDDHTATLLPGGLVLVAGGDWNLTHVNSAELYDPATGAFTHTGAMTESRVYDTATLLQDGTVLIAGTAVSSASKMAPLAPESLGSIFGSGLANRTESADSLSPPTTLGDISLRLIDSSGTARLVPLFYVSPSQITFEVPAWTATGNATVEVVNAPAQPAQSMAEIDNIAPALFAYNDNTPIAYALRIEPDGQQTVLYVQNTIVLDDRPVYLVLYATGIRNRSALANVQCTMGGVGVSVDYAGPAGSGIPGLDQVNVRLTSPLKCLGVSNLFLTVDGASSNTVSVDIR